jgi:phosphoribosylanthranilate isomerase
MALKTKVKVGRITNLSDARYCAGMGVDLLGFQAVPEQPDFMPAERFQEVRGWFSGPLVVAEIAGLKSQEELQAITTHYQPDYFEVTFAELPIAAASGKPLLVRLTPEEWKTRGTALDHCSSSIAFVILPSGSDATLVAEVANTYNVLLDRPIRLAEALTLPIQGIALTGSAEELPGLKSYDSLSDVLDELTVED